MSWKLNNYDFVFFYFLHFFTLTNIYNNITIYYISYRKERGKVKRKILLFLIAVFALGVILFIFIALNIHTLTGVVIDKDDSYFLLRTSDSREYAMSGNNLKMNFNTGDTVRVYFSGDIFLTAPAKVPDVKWVKKLDNTVTQETSTAS